MSDWRPPGADDEDDAVEVDDFFGDIGEGGPDSSSEQVQFLKRDSIIFLIDYREPMHEIESDTGESFFQLALRLAAKVIKGKIIFMEDDYIGVLFFGTEKFKNGSHFPNIFVFNEMDTPDGPQIKALEELAFASPEKRNDLLGKPLSGKANLQSTLWTAQTMFQKSSAKDDAKKIFIFTNDENPVGEDGVMRTQAIQKARDMAELDIVIELFPKQRVGSRSPFDPMIFYKNILTVNDAENDFGDVGFDADCPFSKIEDMVARKKHKRRSAGRLKLSLGSGVELGVKVFTTIRQAKKQPHVLIDSRNQSIIQVNTTWVCNDTGTMLQATQISQSMPFCDQKLPFTAAEIAGIKLSYEPGLVLLGFVERSRIKDYHNSRPCNFIHPAEDVVKGSTTVFSALLSKCLELDQVPIVRITARRNTASRLAALLPQAQSSDASDPAPAGFYIVFLPFADDIRNIRVPEPSRPASREMIDSAKTMIKKTRIKFNPLDFENPALQQHYACLQAMALTEESVPQVEDSVVPEEEAFEKNAALFTAFRDSVYGEEYSDQPLAKKTTGKRSKPEISAEDTALVNAEDWPDLVRSNKIAKKTIPDLKVYLKANGLPVSGKKDDLISRIKSHLGI